MQRRFSTLPCSAGKLIGSGILQASINLLLQCWLHVVDSLLLICRQLSKWMNCLNTLLAEGHLGSKVGQVCDGGHDICTLGGWSACKASQNCLAQSGAGHGHGQSCTTLTILCSDHNCSGILHFLVQSRNICLGNLLAVLVLREHGKDSGACMATNDWNANLAQRCTSDFVDELLSSHHIQGGDAHNLAWVEALLLPKLAHCRHHRVHWIDNQSNHCIWAVLSACLHNVFRNASIDVKQVFPILAWLPWHACWDEHQVATSQALSSFLNGLVIELKCVTFDLGFHVQVGQVSSNTLRRNHSHLQIIDAELRDVWIHGHEQTQRLSNASCAANNAHLEVSSHCALGHTHTQALLQLS
mmetsp:Transcript_23372/g.42980  ORF Transcript_23372/g.42980 Transcript_23372/m.42980 type:complete len:356 (+) Transcript_23372:153-1220(+)